MDAVKLSRLETRYANDPIIADIQDLPQSKRLKILSALDAKDEQLDAKDKQLDAKNQQLEEQKTHNKQQYDELLAVNEKQLIAAHQVIEKLKYREKCSDNLRRIVGTTYAHAAKFFSETTRSPVTETSNHRFLNELQSIDLEDEKIAECWREIRNSNLRLLNSGADEKRDVHPFVKGVFRSTIKNLDLALDFRPEQAMYDPPFRPDGVVTQRYLFKPHWFDALILVKEKAYNEELVSEGIGQALQYLANVHYNLDHATVEENRYGIFTNGREICIFCLKNGDVSNWSSSGLLDFFPENLTDTPSDGFIALCKILYKIHLSLSDEFIQIGSKDYLVLSRLSKKSSPVTTAVIQFRPDCKYVVKWVPATEIHGLMMVSRELENMKHLIFTPGLNLLDFSDSVFNALLLRPIGKTLSEYFADRTALREKPLEKLDVQNEVDRAFIKQLLGIIRKTIRQLQSLHIGSWVHGDIRPDNIIVSDDETVYLIDWLTLGHPGSPEFVANGMNFYAAEERFYDFDNVFLRPKRTHEFRYDIESLAYTIMAMTETAGKLFMSDFQKPGDFFVKRKTLMESANEMVHNPILRGSSLLWKYAREMKETVAISTYDDIIQFFNDPESQ